MFCALSELQADLRARHAESHRVYHDQAHIDAMLRGLHENRQVFARPDAVEVAVWFHDAVYDPAATDNEARSAELLFGKLTGLADAALLERASVMIRATAIHVVPSGIASDLARDASFFLDLDLAVLGAEPTAYDAYEQGIAAEYVPVHGEVRFRAGRQVFLQTMLARPRFFLTDEAHGRFNEPARANMRRAISTLT